MKATLSMLFVVLFAMPVLAAPAYPLDELLARAKFVWIAEVASFDGTTATLVVETNLRGDTDTLSFKVDTESGKPEKGKRYFVFSQGHDRWGEPKNEIKLSQGIRGQGSYCGWIMLLIEKANDEEVVRNAYSFKFRKAEDGMGVLTLEQAKALVRQTVFKGEKDAEQPPGRGSTTQPAR